MAISILFGPGGSGKSLYQLVVIIMRELRTSRRNIVTNLSIIPEALNAYLEKYYPNEPIDLISRLRILNREETLHFWDFRGPSHRGFSIPGPDGSVDYECREDKGVNGVAYIIDEAGVCGFSAQGWAQKENGSTRGVAASWYLDQQRKFGDNVYASHNGTNPHGIAKPFRDKAHDFTQLRNGRLRKMGVFKARALFTAWHYYVEPAPNVEFYAKEDFKLDLELANCYRTGDGVGIVGGKADIGAKVKGIPILWAFPMAMAVGSLCFVVPWALGHSIGHHIVKSSPSAVATVRGAEGAVGRVMGAAVDRRPEAPAVVDDLTVSGYMEFPVATGPQGWQIEHLQVRLSDGQVYSSDEFEVRRLSAGFFLVDGKVYKYVRAPVRGEGNGGMDFKENVRSPHS